MSAFHIRTYGCQMNERDSEALHCLLESHGYVAVESENEADIIFFNTCSVRDQAERKAEGKIGLMKRLKKNRPNLIIGVLGCMARNRGQELIEKMPHIDLVVGPDRFHEIPQMLEEIAAGKHGLVSIDSVGNTADILAGHHPGGISAQVAVMRGCNQFCTYCIVPYTRGREKSRPIADIVREIRQLVDTGVREVLLLGQNVTAYGLAEARMNGTYTPELSPFADLLEAVHEIPGLRRIRFTSPHVKFMNDTFVETICRLPKVCKCFHIPLQSGNNRMLSLMHRGYTVERYRDRIAAIRNRLGENVAFTTDIIVGFPGETEEEFNDTRMVMNEVGYDMAYIFRYSTRTGTHAAKKMVDNISEEVKMARNQLLLTDLERGVSARNKKLVGSTIEVFVEGPSKRNAERWNGRGDSNKVVIFPKTPNLEVGDFVKVKIERTTSHSLFGEIVDD